MVRTIGKHNKMVAIFARLIMITKDFETAYLMTLLTGKKVLQKLSNAGTPCLIRFASLGDPLTPNSFRPAGKLPA